MMQHRHAGAGLLEGCIIGRQNMAGDHRLDLIAVKPALNNRVWRADEELQEPIPGIAVQSVKVQTQFYAVKEVCKATT